MSPRSWPFRLRSAAGTGSELVPDEAALTWTVWMAVVFQGAALQKAG